VTAKTLALARAGDEDAFRGLTDPFRRELQLHCYRILGSVQDAEDAVQETLLSAWRSLEQFEERASVRAWLYRIATNRCLNALRASARRPPELLSSHRPPFELPEPTRLGEPVWLEPYPDTLLEGIPDISAGPEARYETKEAVGLAFITALQRLPPRQRAVLVLRDVLGFRAMEVAGMLESSEVSVNSALQRARTALGTALPGERERAPLSGSRGERELVARFADAFERDDIDGVVALLTDDALATMPPQPHEYQGRAAIGAFLEDRVLARGGRAHRLVPTRAHTQPAFGHYIQDPHASVARATGLFVLTLQGDRVAGITRFGGRRGAIAIRASPNAAAARRHGNLASGVAVRRGAGSRQRVYTTSVVHFPASPALLNRTYPRPILCTSLSRSGEGVTGRTDPAHISANRQRAASRSPCRARSACRSAPWSGLARSNSGGPKVSRLLPSSAAGVTAHTPSDHRGLCPRPRRARLTTQTVSTAEGVCAHAPAERGSQHQRPRPRRGVCPHPRLSSPPQPSSARLLTDGLTRVDHPDSSRPWTAPSPQPARRPAEGEKRFA